MLGDAARVWIRPWRLDDADALHHLVRASQLELARWLSWWHADYGLDDALRWIEHAIASGKARSGFAFAVVDRDDDGAAARLLGGVGLSEVDAAQRCANLGYWVGTPFTGQGIATRAAAQAARFGFDQLGLVRIGIRVLPGNHASLSVARKLGATPQGVVAGGINHHGQLRDALAYVLDAGSAA